MTQYSTLLSIRVEHEYYGHRNSSPFRIEVPDATRSICSSADCLIKSIGNVVRIAAPVHNKPEADSTDTTALAAFVESYPQANIEFYLNTTEPEYHNYTPSITSNLISQFHRALEIGDNVIGSSAPGMEFTGIPAGVEQTPSLRTWNAEKARLISAPDSLNGYTPDRANEAVDKQVLSRLDVGKTTPVFTFENTPNDQGSRKPQIDYWSSFSESVSQPVCVFRLSLADLCQQVQRPESTGGVAVTVKFNSRKVYWRYNLIEFSDDEALTLEVVDRGGRFTFTKLERSHVHGQDAVQFLSDRAISLVAHSTQRFELKGLRKSDGRNREFQLNLPQGSPMNLSVFTPPDSGVESDTNTAISQTQFVSDIFLNK